MTSMWLTSFPHGKCKRQQITEEGMALFCVKGQQLDDATKATNVEKAGFVEKEVKIEEFLWSYYETEIHEESAECIVMIHGFSSNKNSRVAFSGELNKLHNMKYRIILPDMPGHGKTLPKDLSLNYDYTTTVERLKYFLDLVIGPSETFHLMGLSMGGGIAGNFAASYPERLKTVGLWCPHSVEAPQKSDAIIQRETENYNVLVDITYDGTLKSRSMVMHNVPDIPQELLQHMSWTKAQQKDILDKVFGDLDRQRNILNGRLDTITCPVGIFWGENDRLLHVSAVSVLRRIVPGPFVHIFKNCGHGIFYEKLNEALEFYSLFLKSNCKSLEE